MAMVRHCSEVQAAITVFADGELAAGDRAAVEEHLADCAACAREVERIRGNAGWLQEVFLPFRMPAEFDSAFLFQLPRKDAKRRPAAAPAAAAPTTVMMGAPAPERRGRGPLVAGGLLVLVAGGVALAVFGGNGDPRVIHDRRTDPPVVDPGPREERGKGAADPRIPGRTPPDRNGKTPGTPGGTPGTGPTPGTPVRNAAELLASLKNVTGGTYGPAVARAWELLSGTPAEGATVRKAASEEKDGKTRAAIVLCLGADADETNRAALRGYLLDEAPEVRLAAALALARSLSYDSPAKKAVPAGAPLNMAVELGVMMDDPARAELAGRLSSEPDEAVRRVLAMALAPSVGQDPEIRARFVDGVKGVYGDGMRDTCLRSLAGIQDPALVADLAEVLRQPGTPASLHGDLVRTMLESDRNAAVEAFVGLIPAADDAGLRRELVQAVARAGGAQAEQVLRQVLSSDQDASLRAQAARGLEKFPTRDTLGLLESVAQNDADQTVRQEAERVEKIVRAQVEKAEETPAENP